MSCIFIVLWDPIVGKETFESQRRVKVWRWAKMWRTMSCSSEVFPGFEYLPGTPRSNERTCWKPEFVTMAANCLMRCARLTVTCRPIRDNATSENSRAASEQARRVCSSPLSSLIMIETISGGRTRQRGGARLALEEISVNSIHQGEKGRGILRSSSNGSLDLLLPWDRLRHDRGETWTRQETGLSVFYNTGFCSGFSTRSGDLWRKDVNWVPVSS